jgi:hypothetical protein
MPLALSLLQLQPVRPTTPALIVMVTGMVVLVSALSTQASNTILQSDDALINNVMIETKSATVEYIKDKAFDSVLGIPRVKPPIKVNLAGMPQLKPVRYDRRLTYPCQICMKAIAKWKGDGSFSSPTTSTPFLSKGDLCPDIPAQLTAKQIEALHEAGVTLPVPMPGSDGNPDRVQIARDQICILWENGKCQVYDNDAKAVPGLKSLVKGSITNPYMPAFSSLMSVREYLIRAQRSSTLSNDTQSMTAAANATRALDILASLPGPRRPDKWCHELVDDLRFGMSMKNLRNLGCTEHVIANSSLLKTYSNCPDERACECLSSKQGMAFCQPTLNTSLPTCLMIGHPKPGQDAVTIALKKKIAKQKLGLLNAKIIKKSFKLKYRVIKEKQAVLDAPLPKVDDLPAAAKMKAAAKLKAAGAKIKPNALPKPAGAAGPGKKL